MNALWAMVNNQLKKNYEKRKKKFGQFFLFFIKVVVNFF